MTKKTNEEFLKNVKEQVGNEYKFLDKYENSKTKIQVKHTVCGYEYKVSPDNFLNSSSRCPKCCGNIKKTTKEFKQEVYNLVKDEYKVLGKYINVKTKIKMIHTICGHKYNVSPDNFLNSSSRCPKCNASKGEVLIFNFLKENNINFKTQYRIPDCKNILPLPFDFAVFENNRLLGLIEYQGEQHYRPVDFFGGEEVFKQLQIRDYIKNTYCNEKDIPLLKIPFTLSKEEIIKAIYIFFNNKAPLEKQY